MRNMSACIAFVMAFQLSIRPAFAQETRTEQIEEEKAAKAASVQPASPETHMVSRIASFFLRQPPSVRLTLGDFRPAAGFAVGAAYLMPVVQTGLWTTKGAWSVNNFKQAGSAVKSPPLAGGRLELSTAIMWNDAPDLPFFGIGNNSSGRDESSYGLRSIEAGAAADGRVIRWFRYGAYVGYLHSHSEVGAGPEPPLGAVFTAENIPGFGVSPSWLHASANAGIDTRESPGYTRRGELYRVAFNRYSDPGGRFNFDLTEIDLRQFIPLLHENWVIALQGLADITNSVRSQVIPYFMLPSLGGRDTLPGYPPYRFTDKNSLLVRSELRWAASPLVDSALIFDQGMVASTPADLSFQGMHRELGIGARFHGQTITALRLEVFHSAEGWRYNVAKTVSF